MVNHIKKIELELLNSISTSFENLTFAAVEEESSDNNLDKESDETVYGSDILIKNEKKSYMLRLIIPEEYLLQIFETLYPDTKDDNNSIIKDIMAELANTIAGHLMLNIESVVGEFELGLPTVNKDLKVDNSSLINCRYLVDDSFVVRATISEI